MNRKSLLISVFVGLSAGLGAVLFRNLIHIFELLFMGQLYRTFSVDSFGWTLIFIPAIGGLIVGLLIMAGAKEARGHGVPEVMEAVALRQGKIKLKVAFTKISASAISIASGGSVGREGPIVQIGATLGSVIARLFRADKEQVKVLLAAGAAGGIAATFNAPLAGVFFSLEVILRDFTVKSFPPVVISAIVASFMSHTFFGNVPAFEIVPLGIVHYLEMLNFLILGALAALTGVLFTKTLYKCEDLFSATKLPVYLQTFAGGLLLGIIALYFPQVLSIGYGPIETALVDGFTIKMLLMILIAKIAATSVTIGSGGSGGIFAPSIFLGVFLGTLCGKLSAAVFGTSTHPAAYAIVGMGAVVTATTHAPLTAILIIFEMTRNYSLILPLMIAVMMSLYLAQILLKDSIYTLKLTRRGIHLFNIKDKDLLSSIGISEVMNRDIVTMKTEDDIDSVKNTVREYHYTEYPVLNDNEDFIGIAMSKDIQNWLMEPEQTDIRKTEDILRPKTLTAYHDENVMEVWKRYGNDAFDHIWVVDRKNPLKLLGVCTYRNLLKHYLQINEDNI